ncbi:MAG: DNA repair protein RecN [Spirochaetales bacterium]|nr:DNA repair protein RecN [Spirochaetales bacterium]
MLEELNVRNFALVESESMQFGAGFNVLTGETGAGKSILVDALSLVLGAKGNGESVRKGANQAEVSARIGVPTSPELTEWAERYGIEPEDGSLIVRRVLKTNGRGGAWVQSVPVTRLALSELASLLVDIHGQHEHQGLFKTALHRRYLDRYAGIEERVSAFTLRFSELAALGRRLEDMAEAEGRAAQEAQDMRKALQDIDEAELQDGEEEELGELQRRLAGHEELSASLDKVLEAASEARGGALAKLRIAREGLEQAGEIDSRFEAVTRRFDGAFFELEDLLDDLRRQRDSQDFDPAELERVDQRLAQILALQKKHACVSIAQLLERAREYRERLETFDGRDEERRQLEAQRDALQKEVVAESSALSQKRQQAAVGLQERVENHLKALGMGDARFVVSLEGRRNGDGRTVVGPYGSDEVEFLLSANRGEEPKPLKSVASGGELSRVMLAVKTVLSEVDAVATMIFDEVDTGIGGEVARSVGEHLRGLSQHKQVFCITHLASIAVFADNHLQVSKSTVGDRTLTRVRQIVGDQRVGEVARMLAGDQEDSASLDHAARLLNEHQNTKSGAKG